MGEWMSSLVYFSLIFKCGFMLDVGSLLFTAIQYLQQCQPPVLPALPFNASPTPPVLAPSIVPSIHPVISSVPPAMPSPTDRMTVSPSHSPDEPEEKTPSWPSAPEAATAASGGDQMECPRTPQFHILTPQVEPPPLSPTPTMPHDAEAAPTPGASTAFSLAKLGLASPSPTTM